MKEAPAAAAATTARHRMVAFTLAMVAIAYLDRVCIATAIPAIKADLGLGDGEIGVVFSAFTLAYALFEVPGGWIADRFGARGTLTRIVVWWSIMTAATGLAVGFTSLVALRFLFGVGEAGAFPATARAYARWLPERERGRAFGLAIMTGALGGALTQPLVVGLLAMISWRHAFAIFGCVGIAWAAAWWLWFRDDPAEHASVNVAELRTITAGGPPHRDAGPVPWAEIASNRSLVALCGMYFGVIYGWYFYLTWLPTYLLRARGFNLTHMGLLAALPLIGIAAGVAYGGWWSDRLAATGGSRRTPALIGLPLAAAAICLAATTRGEVESALFMTAAAALAAFGVAPAWAVATEMGGARAGLVTGAMNMCGNLGGALSPLVVGYSLQWLGSWEAPLFSVAALYVFASLCWLAVDPARTVGRRAVSRASA
jgi:MFS transporter, ACS family, glucarate transporter